MPAATMRRCRHQRAMTVSRDGTPNLSVRPLRPGLRTVASRRYAAHGAEPRCPYHTQDERKRSNHFLCQGLNLAISIACSMCLAGAIARVGPRLLMGWSGRAPAPLVRKLWGFEPRKEHVPCHGLLPLLLSPPWASIWTRTASTSLVRMSAAPSWKENAEDSGHLMAGIQSGLTTRALPVIDQGSIR